MSGIPQWTVRGSAWTDRTRVFEDEGRAVAHALQVASPTVPSVVTTPLGVHYLVLRVDPLVEVTTKVAYSPVRQVVEL